MGLGKYQKEQSHDFGGTIISATDVMLNSGNYSVDMRCVTNEWEWWKQPELEKKSRNF